MIKVAAKAKRARSRRYKRSTRAKWLLLSAVATLFIVAAGYFVLGYLLGDNHLSQAAQLVPESVYAFRRLNRIRAVLNRMVRLAVSPVLSTVEFRPAYPEVLASQIKLDLDELRQLQQSLMYGSVAWNLPGSVRRNKMRDDLDFGNACKYLDPVGMNRMDELPLGDVTCEAFANGVFMRGLSAGFTLFVDAMEDTLSLLSTVSSDQLTNTTRIQQFLASPEWMEIELMDRNLLRYGLVIESRTYINDLVQKNSTFISLQAGLLSGFLIVLILAYYAVYDPIIRALDRQLKQARSLLLMIPTDVVQNSLAMRKAILNS